MSKPKKQTFEVSDTESISDCLERMAKEGYSPVRRMEKPIFQEVKEGGETRYVPVGRQIVFEARLME